MPSECACSACDCTETVYGVELDSRELRGLKMALKLWVEFLKIRGFEKK